jgi:hypothetical protein
MAGANPAGLEYIRAVFNKQAFPLLSKVPSAQQPAVQRTYARFQCYNPAAPFFKGESLAGDSPNRHCCLAQF